MSADSSSGSIQSRKDFKKNPSDQFRYWELELKASFKRTKQWHTQADMIQRRYIDDRTGQGLGGSALGQGAAAGQGSQSGRFRLNLFHSNAKTILNMLYGKLPRIDVSRTDTTGGDDVGRVAAEVMERVLRQDLANHGAEHSQIFKAVLMDRMLPGLGCARVRYAVETGKAAPYGPKADLDAYTTSEDASDTDEDAAEEILGESAPFDYYYWADMAWGWGRQFSELPWIGFRSYLDKDEVTGRFGKDVAEKLQYKQREVSANKDGISDPDMNSAWQKAEIWEIWDKHSKKLVWLSLGYDQLLETKKDTLKLSGFYPCPPFFIANITNALYLPTPDYHLAQDLYNEIDVLQTRIAILTEAVRVVGVYDAAAEGIQRMFKEGNENDLIPVDNWAMFAEKGGIQGQVDWLPLMDIVGALEKLRGIRDETIGLLQQVTGMADIMRGELDNQYEGVGQTQVKAKFASSRIQALSEEFATFVTDLQQIKAEVICKHFSPETIVKMANMQFSPDRELVPDAIALLKNKEQSILRIEIKSETMAQEDYAQLQNERASYLNGLSTFIQSATPLIQQDPRSTPFLLEMLKWAMAGFKSASDVEGILDRAIETMSQPEQQKEPEPSDADKQAQAQIELEKIRQQGKQQEMQAKLQQDMQIREQDMQMDIQTRQEEHRMAMELAQSNTQNELAVIAAKMEADVQTEIFTSRINAEQQQAGVESQVAGDLAKAKIAVMQMREGKMLDRETKLMEKAMESHDKDKDRAAQPKPEK